eukprot:COSAG06_NODE_15020_length_1104_cov_1.092537_2_plen_25_part_01
MAFIILRFVSAMENSARYSARSGMI